MAFILAIETTTKNCSVALFENERLLALKEHCSDDYSHAEQLTLFITEVLQKTQLTLKNINAVRKTKTHCASYLLFC